MLSSGQKTHIIMKKHVWNKSEFPSKLAFSCSSRLITELLLFFNQSVKVLCNKSKQPFHLNFIFRKLVKVTERKSPGEWSERWLRPQIPGAAPRLKQTGLPGGDLRTAAKQSVQRCTQRWPWRGDHPNLNQTLLFFVYRWITGTCPLIAAHIYQYICQRMLQSLTYTYLDYFSTKWFIWL